MHYLLLIAFLSLVHAALGNEPLKVPSDRRTILKSGEWTPTPAQAQRAFARIQTFLQRPDASDALSTAAIAAIIGNKIGYRVQYYGARRNGKDIIVCNFFPAKDPKRGDLFSEWQEREIVVDDGGFDFWSIEYDPATDRCGAFRWNGVA